MDKDGQQNYWDANNQTTGDQPVDYSGDQQDQSAPQQQITWQASEYAHHEKGFLWYLALIGAIVVIAALSIFVVKSITFAILVAVMGAALVVFARRPPRNVQYTLSESGIQIDQKKFAYEEFKYFGLSSGAIPTIVLMPTKRFMPMVSLYIDPQNIQAIVEYLASYMPMQQVKPDWFEVIAARLRF